MAARTRVVGLLSALLLLVACTSSASACGYRTARFGGVYGCGAIIPSRLHHERTTYFSYLGNPYYALGYLTVPRATCEPVVAPAPLRIKNPFVGAKPEEKRPYEREPEVKPLRIQNPHVQS